MPTLRSRIRLFGLFWGTVSWVRRWGLRLRARRSRRILACWGCGRPFGLGFNPSFHLPPGQRRGWWCRHCVR